MPEDDGSSSHSSERTPLLKDLRQESRQMEDQQHKVDDLAEFKLQPFELYEMVGTKDVDALEKHGGTDKVVELLLSDAKKGLSKDKLDPEGKNRQERERIYGQNKLPEKQMKSFLDSAF